MAVEFSIEAPLLRKIMTKQITQCVSELQSLDADFATMNDKDFEIKAPESYSDYQILFIHAVLSRMAESAVEEDE